MKPALISPLADFREGGEILEAAAKFALRRWQDCI